MKAAVSDTYGPAEIVSLEEVETPIPKSKEVRVKVHATTVNRTDCAMRAAHPFLMRFFQGFFRPKHKILGSEFTGIVDAVGEDVQSFEIGTAVFGISASNYGAHAEYLCMHEEASIASIPENLSVDDALAICEGAWYAWNNLKEVRLQEGDTMLVNGGSGSIGSAAIQLAKSFGVEITAVTNTQNLELVQDLGASHVIDYTQEDFTQLDTQFDYVFDAVGKSTYFKCKRLLKPKGVFFSTELGAFLQNPLLAIWTSRSHAKRVLFPIPEDKRENLLFFKRLAEAGKLRPVIDRVFPFDKIVEAYKYVETGQKTGSVVVRIAN